MIHQIYTCTLYNRYPLIFDYVSKLDINNKRVLSFGCSFGDEISTLKTYFVDSDIFGVDINQECVNECRKHFGVDKIRHYSEFISGNDMFDVIFAMSVFCRWEDTENVDDCSSIYPFSQFEDGIKILDSRLNSGGIICIYNANFRFSDTEVQSKYTPLSLDTLNESGFVHKFDKNNIKIWESYPHAIFKKK